MNENTEFDLEWAKRGGLLINKGRLCKYTKGGGEQAIHISPISHSPLRIICMQAGCRMATREECESAGIEYIERPVSGQELVELREEIERLKEAEIESDFVREKLATLLAEIAIAVKGLPNELQAHDLSDLPEICRELREDKEMLEWMFSPDIFRVVTTDRTYDGTFKSFKVREVSDLSYLYFDTLSIGSTPREAIRAAMKGGM